MKKIIYLLILTPLFSFGQIDYNWTDVQEVTFYDLTKIATVKNCYFEDVNKIQSNAPHISSKTADWKNLLLKTTTDGFDVVVEDCYLLVVKFKDNKIIPFSFLPKQRALMDLRKKHFLILFFGQDTEVEVDALFKQCVDCIKDPKCAGNK